MLEAPDSQATRFLLGMPRWNMGILAMLFMQCLWSNVASVSACCWGAWCMRNAQPTSSRNSTPKLMSSYVDSQQINMTTHSLLCKALLFSKHNVSTSLLPSRDISVAILCTGSTRAPQCTQQLQRPQRA